MAPRIPDVLQGYGVVELFILDTRALCMWLKGHFAFSGILDTEPADVRHMTYTICIFSQKLLSLDWS